MRHESGGQEILRLRLGRASQVEQRILGHLPALQDRITAVQPSAKPASARRAGGARPPVRAARTAILSLHRVPEGAALCLSLSASWRSYWRSWPFCGDWRIGWDRDGDAGSENALLLRLPTGSSCEPLRCGVQDVPKNAGAEV